MRKVSTRGPAPKRRAGRYHRADQQPDVVHMVGEVVQPPADESWHPEARAWYDSLAESKQVRYYEPSDWAFAQLVAEVMSRVLRAEQPKASLVKQVLAGMRKLGPLD